MQGEIPGDENSGRGKSSGKVEGETPGGKLTGKVQWDSPGESPVEGPGGKSRGKVQGESPGGTCKGKVPGTKIPGGESPVGKFKGNGRVHRSPVMVKYCNLLVFTAPQYGINDTIKQCK